jgi:hypothetical protein
MTLSERDINCQVNRAKRQLRKYGYTPLKGWKMVIDNDKKEVMITLSFMNKDGSPNGYRIHFN